MTTDSSGVRVEYRPLEQLLDGDEIAGGWRPWAKVASVEIDGPLGRIYYETHGPTAWFPLKTLFPVVVEDEAGRVEEGRRLLAEALRGGRLARSLVALGDEKTAVHRWLEWTVEHADALLGERAALKALLPDVDSALANYGIAFTSTPTPDDVRKAAFEEARLALRRVRDALAGGS